MDCAEDKPTGLRATARRVLPEVALWYRWLDDKNREVSAGKVLLTGPSGHSDNHDAEVAGTRFGTPVDSRVVSILGCV
jgi:hypothetical protein